MSESVNGGSKAVPDISMEDTDAAAQRIPDELSERAAGESFSGAPTMAPPSRVDSAPQDFSVFAEVDPDDYVFGPEIARGGMGRILAARDRRTGRAVAIKEVLPELMAGLSEKERDGLIARFQREARVTALLQHPSIVPVYEIGNFRGRPFFAMKKIEGEGLDSLISARKTLEQRLELLPTIVSLAEALAYAHGQRVVHRDLKSSNILVGAFGETVVIDWGLAKSMSDAESDAPMAASKTDFDSMHPLKTVAGAIFGTPHFMPPEQARGDAVDERADVYAIGSILYHLLSGQAPYADSQATPQSGSLLHKLREVPPSPLPTLVADVPRDLLSIVDKAMARDKSQRYPSAAELATDLADFSAGQRVGVHHYSRSELLTRWLRRHKTAVATALILLSALAITATISIRSVVKNRDTAEAAARRALIETKRADKSTDEAMEFLAERGRIDLLDEHPVHALVLLSKAFSHLAARPSSQVLMAAAMRTIDSLQQILPPHSSTVFRLELSHDKSKMLSASVDGEVRIWDAHNTEVIQTLRPQLGRARAFPSLSRDDSKVLTASEHGVEVWNAESGKLLASIADDVDFAAFDHRDRIITLNRQGELTAWDSNAQNPVKLYHFEYHSPFVAPAVSDDGKRLIVAVGEVFVFDLEHDTVQTRESGNGPRLLALNAGPNSQRFVTASSNGAVELWSSTTAARIAKVTPPYGANQDQAVAASPDNKLLAIAGADMTISIYDIEQGKMAQQFDARVSEVTKLKFSPDSNILAMLGTDEVARLWDVGTGRWRTSFVGQPGMGTALEFSADGSSLFVGDDEGGIRKWDATADIVALDQRVRSSYSAVDRTGRRVIAAGKKELVLHDANSMLPIASISDASLVDDVQFSADGERFFTGNEVYRSEDGSLIRSLDVAAEAGQMVGISGDGQVVGVSKREGIRIWSVATGKLLFEHAFTTAMPSPLWLTQRGDYLLAMLDNFELCIVEISSGKVFDFLGDKILNRYMVSFLGRPDYVLINRLPKSLDLVDIKTGNIVRSLEGSFTSITVAPDGVRALVASSASAMLWNTETGEVEAEVQETLTKRTYSGAVSKDGALFAVASLDRISIYDRASATLLSRTSIGRGSVIGIIFTSDDQTLLISGTERTVVLDIHRETRPPSVIEAIVEERVPRILERGHFLPVPSANSSDAQGRDPSN